MKCLCITGSLQPDLNLVLGILQQAGLRPASATKREQPVGIAWWHDQVVAMARADQESGDVEPALSITEPGRMWEQLASDILLANIKQDVWGWASPNSTWLLDFWLGFDPRINFILVCTSPEHVIAHAMTAVDDMGSLDALMNTWQVQHQQMLRFYHRNPGRCLLVDATDCAHNLAALLERCVDRWKLPLSIPADFAVVPADQGALTLHLATQIASQYPEAFSLKQELAATISSLSDNPHTEAVDALNAADLLAEYRRLRNRLQEETQLQEAHQELISLRELHERTVATNARIEKELAVKISEQGKENELLLLQLHQVQEELETQFLSHEKLRKANATLEQGKSVLTQQLAMPVVNTAQAPELKVLEGRLIDAEKENELLLLQLHQVQEELEHYFLQHQDAHKQIKTAHERWLRMLQRNPGYCDYAAIDVLEVHENTGTTTWRIKEFNAGGRSLPELQFKLVLEQGLAGLVLNRQPGTNGPLLRWPVSDADTNDLPLAIAGTQDEMRRCGETLLNLATSDWELFTALIRMLNGALEQPALLAAPANLPAAALRQGLAQLDQVLNKLPPLLRFDQVVLEREQVNHDYEHLWLRFDNLAFGKQRWPAFEFRLSCANLRPGVFGHYPKLEFPKDYSQATFDNWFAESHDDFGAKLELRFASPAAMDIAVWQRLSAHDQQFLRALINRLPAILATLEGANVCLQRPWQDWQKLTAEIQRLMALCAPAVANIDDRVAPISDPAPLDAVPAEAIASAPKPTTSKSAKQKSVKRS